MVNPALKKSSLRFCSFLVVLAVLLALPFPSHAAGYKQIVVATGSPYELGLVDALAKAFKQQGGCTVRCVKTPTEPGLELGRNGLAHITMGHHHTATGDFVRDGYARERADLMYNLTVIVGPKNDPAGIRGLADVREAHRKIAQARAKYLSRGDGGGMHLLELETWSALKINPKGQPWYEVSNKFMLDSLLDSNRQGQYHMLDSSTWVMHRSKTPGLDLLVSGPRNEYEICLVNPDKNPNLKYNADCAEKFYRFCTGEAGRKVIAEFGKDRYGDAIYYPWPKK